MFNKKLWDRTHTAYVVVERDRTMANIRKEKLFGNRYSFSCCTERGFFWIEPLLRDIFSGSRILPIEEGDLVFSVVESNFRSSIQFLPGALDPNAHKKEHPEDWVTGVLIAKPAAWEKEGRKFDVAEVEKDLARIASYLNAYKNNKLLQARYHSDVGDEIIVPCEFDETQILRMAYAIRPECIYVDDEFAVVYKLKNS